MQILFQCHEVLDLWKGDMRMLRYLLLLDAVSLSHEVDGLSPIWPLPGVWTPKWTVLSHKFPGIDVYLTFLHIIFISVFELFSYHILVVQKVLVRGDGCPTF